MLNEQGMFTCSNPHRLNFENVFKAVEVKVVRSLKTYRETVYTAARMNVPDRAITFVTLRAIGCS